jgi:hypothetical protein
VFVVVVVSGVTGGFSVVAGATVSAGALVPVVDGGVSAGGAGVGATVFVVFVVSGVAGGFSASGGGVIGAALVSEVAAEVTAG